MTNGIAGIAARIGLAKRALAEAYDELARQADEIEEAGERGNLNALLWECAAGQFSRDRYFSQYGQDAYIDAHVFGRRRNGVFVDVGGFDGVSGSNSLFFEIFRGWSGLLIEAVAEHADAAREFRRCPCLNTLVGDGRPAEFLTIDGGPVQMSGLVDSYDPRRRAWVEGQPGLSARREMRATERLGDILQAQGLSRIDLLCLDVEGAEETVLAGFPFDAIEVSCWCIETADDRQPVTRIMQGSGFEWIDRIGHDDIYVAPELA